MSEESDWTDETGEDDDDMDYEPTTEGEGEDIRDILQLLEEEAEEEDDDEEYHGMILCGFGSFLALIKLDAEYGYTMIEVGIDDEGEATETEAPQDANAARAHGGRNISAISITLTQLTIPFSLGCGPESTNPSVAG